jgi:plasmid stabilization system protein ParE
LIVAVHLSDAALADLEDALDWLLQPGSGPSGRTRVQEIADAIGDLRETAGRHPPDPFLPGNHQLVIHRHVVSYAIRRTTDGGMRVDVDRIYGPDRRRP